MAMTKQQLSDYKYNHSPKGRARGHRYDVSPLGRRRHARNRRANAAKIALLKHRWNHSKGGQILKAMWERQFRRLYRVRNRACIR